MTKWDSQSGIRERLALLARFGPTLSPRDWAYNPYHDSWTFQGLESTAYRHRHVKVTQEAVESLRLLLDGWGVDRKTAMGLIGFPEER